MDTTWFAVDRDGHIAIFESGEAGAVPTEAYSEDNYEAMENLPAPRRPSEPVYVLEGHAEPGRESHIPLEHRPNKILVFLNELGPAAEDVGEGRAREVRAASGHALLYEEMSDLTHARLHATAACRGCFGHYEDDETPQVARKGLYEYSHTTDNWIAGPYGLRTRPSEPITIDALPAGARPPLVRFDGRFAETPILQPVGRWPSDAWGAAYLAEDGKKVRPIPGREDDYRDEYNDYDQGGSDGLELEPPAGGPVPRPTKAASSAPTATAPTPRKPWWKFWS
jgi:hypothetical protein